MYTAKNPSPDYINLTKIYKRIHLEGSSKRNKQKKLPDDTYNGRATLFFADFIQRSHAASPRGAPNSTPSTTGPKASASSQASNIVRAPRLTRIAILQYGMRGSLWSLIRA